MTIIFIEKLMLTKEKAQKIAHQWIKAWNDRDLDKIMFHYENNILLISPIAVKILDKPNGTVSGKKELRKYFQKGLEIYPNLRFDLQDIMWGISSLVLYYVNQNGTKAGEFMEISTSGKISRVIAHYDN